MALHAHIILHIDYIIPDDVRTNEEHITGKMLHEIASKFENCEIGNDCITEYTTADGANVVLIGSALDVGQCKHSQHSCQ